MDRRRFLQALGIGVVGATTTKLQGIEKKKSVKVKWQCPICRKTVEETVFSEKGYYLLIDHYCDSDYALMEGIFQI